MSATMISVLIAVFLGSTGGKIGGLAAKNKGFGIVGNPLIGTINSLVTCQSLVSMGILLNTQYLLIGAAALVSSFATVLVGSYFKKEQVNFSEED